MGRGGGGGEWEATEMDAINQLKIHFDSLVKVISKKKKAAKIKRLINNEKHVTPSLWSTCRSVKVWVTRASVIFNAFKSLILLLIKIKSFYNIYTWNGPYLWFFSTIFNQWESSWRIRYKENDYFHRRSSVRLCWERMQQCNKLRNIIK